MNEKKKVNRNIALALGIICVILTALVAYFTVADFSTQNGYNDLLNQNKQLQAWLEGNKTMLIQSQANNTDLFAIVHLLEYSDWVYNQTISEPANSYYEFNFSVDYAGYVSVYIQSSTTNTTYVQAINGEEYGIHYDNPMTLTVGTNGTAIFPVLPPPYTLPFQVNFTTTSNSSKNKSSTLPMDEVQLYYNLHVLIGNTDSVGNATQTIIITYYY
jgi:cell division protein FtsB